MIACPMCVTGEVGCPVCFLSGACEGEPVPDARVGAVEWDVQCEVCYQ